MKTFFSDIGALYIDHLAVTTPVFHETLSFYLEHNGARLLKGPGWNSIQKVHYAFVALPGEITVEILGVAEDSPIVSHVKRGGGAYHLCYAVRDLDAAVKVASAAGAVVLTAPSPDVAFDGRRVIFLSHRITGIFEMVEAYPEKMASFDAAFEPAASLSEKPGALDVDSRLLKVLKGVLPKVDVADLALLSINQAEGWDSLAHLQIMMEVELVFGVKLTPEDIVNATSYKDLLPLLRRKMLS